MSIFEDVVGSAAGVLEVDVAVPLVLGRGEAALGPAGGALAGGGEREACGGLLIAEDVGLDDGPRGGERVRTEGLGSRIGDRERVR